MVAFSKLSELLDVNEDDVLRSAVEFDASVPTKSDEDGATVLVETELSITSVAELDGA